MSIAEFMNSISPEAQALLSVSVLWLAGFLMSRVSKVFGLPNVTGYILAGVVIGPYCLNLLPTRMTQHLSFVTDAALAMIAFGVGRYLDLSVLKSQGTRILILTLMEALTAAVIVTLVMLFVFQLPLPFALLLGAIGSATAPASSLMTIRQYRAKGPFVNTLIQVVALDDVVALLAFSVCAAIASSSTHAENWLSMLTPVAVNLAVLLGCYVLGRLLCAVLQGRSPDHRIVLTCTFIFLIAGVCAIVNVSPLLGCMMLGATYVNVTGDKGLFKQVNRISPPVNILFFVLSGMRLNIQALASAGVIGVTYFAVRIVGKYAGSYMGCKMIGSPKEVRDNLGFALIPQAGVSIGLAVLAQRILPEESGVLINTIILSSSVLYEMIGPMSAKYALFRSGAIRNQNGTAPAASTPKNSTPLQMENQSASTIPARARIQSLFNKKDKVSQSTVTQVEQAAPASSGSGGEGRKEKEKDKKGQKKRKGKREE